MSKTKLAGFLAATAVVTSLAVAPAGHAQTMVPPPQPMMAPMQAPPDRLDFYSDAPKAEPGDFSWSARQNVVDSDRYERLVHTNPAFRAARIRQECGPMTEPDLYQQCVASFDE
ncbi:MAG TPA: hypothetical protein VK432_04820 [Stellaceae bacterium]|nr:hypothetical protein [Stellaceae bacterium]